MKMDHRSAPIFISCWTLIGLLVLAPEFGHLLVPGVDSMRSSPLLFGLAACKGAFLWLRYHEGQKLNYYSLSAQTYTLPAALGFIAIGNYFLGEQLTTVQWGAALGLCLSGIIFSIKGHLQDLPTEAKKSYFLIIVLATLLANIDHVVISESNWYILLLVSNIFMLLVAVAGRAPLFVWKQALFSKASMLTGSLFALAEMVKFYQQVTINPVSVVISVQVCAIPLILVISSLAWRERGWKEQIGWGMLSLCFLILLLVL